MTNEESIINNIKSWMDEGDGRFYFSNEDVNTIYNALGKQIPKKPIDLYFDKRCPSCESIWGVKKGQEFCDKCGQHIDWGNE